MPKIIHILSGDLWAGAEVMAINLLRALTAAGYDRLTAVLLNDGPVAETLRAGGLNVAVIPESGRSFSGIVRDFRRIIRDIEADVIHSHGYKENLINYAAVKAPGGIRPGPGLVATQHGMPEAWGHAVSVKRVAIRRLNFFLLAHCFDCCVAVSRDLKKALAAASGIRPDKIAVIRNGITMPEIPGRRDNKTFLAGSCGRLFPVKNFALFVEIAAQVKFLVPDIHFVLAGDGPQKEMIERLCRDHGLTGIFSMPGHVSDMGRLYREMDVFINTSFHEGLPMSVLEAMAHGVPVIAPRVGGFPEIVENGVDGFLINGHSVDGFAQKCLELFNDDGMRTRMSAAARRKIEKKFSSAQMAIDYGRLYNRIARPGRRKQAACG